MTLWIKDPAGILAEDADRGLVVDGSIIVERVAAGDEPASAVTEVLDAGEHVVLPGLINTHHHFYQTLTRAFDPALDKELFPWLQALFPVWQRLTPEALDAGVTLAMAELLLSGCTTTTDHHYVFPEGLEEAIDIEVAAAERLGIRVVLTRGSMDLSVDDGGLPPREITQSPDRILADSERLIARYHQAGEGAMTQISLAPCSPFASTQGLMRDTAALARQHGVVLHTHLAETEDETNFCQEMFGCRPVDYIEELGWLADDVWLAHGIHFTDNELGRLARAGTAITHCPSSNMILGSGSCRVPELEAAGCSVGLGVDGSASNDCSNMIQEVRQAFLIQRHLYGVERISHRDALRWASKGSAGCIGRSDLGALEVGKQADLALFKLDELRFSGHGNPLAAIVQCGAHQADRVMVGGRWAVEDGAIPGVDLDALRRRHHDAARRLQGANRTRL